MVIRNPYLAEFKQKGVIEKLEKLLQTKSHETIIQEIHMIKGYSLDC
jgi:hypothetical protein